MSDDDELFKGLEDSLSEDEKAKNALRTQIHAAAALWPEFLAMFSGMVQSAMDEGWEEVAARALVLASVTGAANANVLANLKAYDDDPPTTS